MTAPRGWGRPQAPTPAPSHRALRSQGKSLCSEDGGCGSCSPRSLTRLGTEEHHRPWGHCSQVPGRTGPRPSWTAHKLLPSQPPSQARRGRHGSKAHRTGCPGWGRRHQGSGHLGSALHPLWEQGGPPLPLVCPSFLPCGLHGAWERRCSQPARGRGATLHPGRGWRHRGPVGPLGASGPRGTLTGIGASWDRDGHWGLVAL